MMKGLLIGTVLVVVFLGNFWWNLGKPLGLEYRDAALVSFTLNHYKRVFETGNWQGILTLPMFYGFKDSLLFTDHHFIFALFAWPLYKIWGSVIVGMILASFWAMYLLAWHWTKDTLVSLIASVLFVFNPVVFTHYPDHLILISLLWIPLIFLFFERFLERQNWKDGLAFFLVLTAQLLSSLYYSAFLTVILPIYIGVRLWQKKFPLVKLIQSGTVVGFVLLTAVAVGTAGLYLKVYSKETIGRNLDQTDIFFSPWVTDLAFTSSKNVVYGGLREKLSQKYPAFFHQTFFQEQDLFPGIVAVILLIGSIGILKKRGKDGIWRLWVGLAILSLVLAFGPIIHFSRDIAIPGLYGLIYKIDPVLWFLRAPSRIIVFSFFFSALMIAIGTKFWLEGRGRITRWLIGGVVITLMLVEYWNTPLHFTYISDQMKSFYARLEAQSQIKVIVDLPIANIFPADVKGARYIDLDSQYMLWATVLHSKKILNGYSGFIPDEYYKRADLLSFNFPSPVKLSLLRKWGVDGIVLHRSEFSEPADYDLLRKQLKVLQVPETITASDLSFFDLTGWGVKEETVY
jgi:hypothetical protein